MVKKLRTKEEMTCLYYVIKESYSLELKDVLEVNLFILFYIIYW